MNDSLDRRTLLRSTGAIAAAGLLAGCSSDGESGDGGDGGSGDGSDGGDGGSDDTTTTADTEASEEVASYLDGVSNFDGTVSVMTGQDTVTVSVGAEGNSGNFAFAPAAVRVSTGTTVEFEWTGEGSTHNVVSDGDGPLDSGSAVDAEGVQYEYTFEEAGTYTYNCTPHASLGMKGAIVVV